MRSREEPTNPSPDAGPVEAAAPKDTPPANSKEAEKSAEKAL